MLGLGLSLTSPRIIGTTVVDGEVVAIETPALGSPGPSTTDDLLTQVFHTEVINTGPNEQTMYIYELIVPGTTIDNVLVPVIQIPALIEDYEELAGTNATYTQSGILPISHSDTIANGALISTPTGTKSVCSPFQKFVQYLIEEQDVVADVFNNPGSIATELQTYLSQSENSLTTHGFIFNQSFGNVVTEALFNLSFLEYLYSDEFPFEDLTQESDMGNWDDTSATTNLHNIAFYRENVVVLNTAPLIPLPQFGIAPTVASFVSLEEGVIGSSDTGFALLGNSFLGSNLPLATLPYTPGQGLTFQFSIIESYIEVNGIPLTVNHIDLYPLGADSNGDVAITTFNTHLTIEYTDSDNQTLYINKEIPYTDSGSNYLTGTLPSGPYIVKNFFYNGSFTITEEEFPALFSAYDAGIFAVEVNITNIYNSMPESSIYVSSDMIPDPFPFGSLYIPAVGVTAEDLIQWLGTVLVGSSPPPAPGTSLALIPASDDTYNATPPGTQPQVAGYTPAIPLKGRSTNFNAAPADLSTAYATSGTDFTFIAIGLNKNISSSTEELIVNRTGTNEGIGIKSSDTYIKLKNGSTPTDTTPGGAASTGYSTAEPFFIYIEKIGTVVSQYNEYNELVKRYTVGGSEILEINRITNNFTGNLSYIAVEDDIKTQAARARAVEKLRVRYIDISNINRYE